MTHRCRLNLVMTEKHTTPRSVSRKSAQPVQHTHSRPPYGLAYFILLLFCFVFQIVFQFIIRTIYQRLVKTMLGLWKQRKGEGLTFPKPVEESPVAVEPIEPIGRIEQVETTELPPIDDNTNVAKTKKISKKKAKALTDGATANISNIAVTAADGEISRDTPTADKLPPVEAAIEIPPSGDDNIAPTITISSNIEPKKRKPPTSKPKKSKVDTPTTTATNTSSVMTVSTLIAMATGTQEAAIPVAHHDDTHIQETIPETAPLPQVAVDIPFVPPSQPLEEILAPMEVDMKYERLHWKIVPASTSRKSNMLLWKYFRVYDASTKCSDTIICTMCYERKRHLLGAYPRQWEVRIGDSKSTSHLAQHLRHQHKEEYQEYVQARELYGKGFRPNKADVSGTFSPEEESTTHLTTFGGVSSGPGGMNQALDQSFTGEETFDGMVDEPSSSHRIEDRFIRSYLHWVIEDCQPLQSCQLSNFTAMWKSSTRKDVNIDIQVLTTAIQQEVQEAKRLLHTIFLSCPVVFSVNSWQGKSFLFSSPHFIII